MSDLKPCPFCGGTAKLRRFSEPRPDAKPDSFSVKCTVCCAESNWFKTDGYALEAWNTRADQWQPIETAPHDKRVLVWSGHEIYAANWVKHPITGDEAWCVAEWGDGDQALVKPTLWMPIDCPKPMEKTNG